MDEVWLATIIGRDGQGECLDTLLREQFGCAAPGPGKVGFGQSGDLIWSAPGQWLAVCKGGRTVDELTTVLVGVAAVTDQSDSRALVRWSGPRAHDALAAGIAIDLHPTVFARGATAVTKVAHLSVQIWQIDDEPAYMIAVPCSFVSSFWSWTCAACAPFGYDVTMG